MSGAQSGDTSKDLIYQEIRRSIVMGHRQPGERLDLDALSEVYGTSITPIRDALQMLGHEGLITIKPRSGYYVTHVTLKQLHDLLELREILEVAAVERATPRISDEQLAQLEHVHAGYTGDDDEAYDRYTDENRRFHCLVAEASGNEELAEALGRLHDRLARFMVMRRAGQTMERTHALIIQSMRARDVAAARQAMLDEISETRRRVLDQVIQEEGAFWQLGAPSETS